MEEGMTEKEEEQGDKEEAAMLGLRLRGLPAMFSQTYPVECRCFFCVGILNGTKENQFTTRLIWLADAVFSHILLERSHY